MCSPSTLDTDETLRELGSTIWIIGSRRPGGVPTPRIRLSGVNTAGPTTVSFGRSIELPVSNSTMTDKDPTHIVVFAFLIVPADRSTYRLSALKLIVVPVPSVSR